ncbi:MAG: hypothetical protein E4H01_09515 [Lysobacterales bacterium]|nr:MAG: hypothetical protein E4H01_09515 [Xanthomonadales bacterium]
MIDRPPTEAVARKAIKRALMELSGNTNEPMHPAAWWNAIAQAMNRYLGPSMGMTTEQRWDRLKMVEIWLLTESLEERAAIKDWY